MYGLQILIIGKQSKKKKDELGYSFGAKKVAAQRIFQHICTWIDQN